MTISLANISITLGYGDMGHGSWKHMFKKQPLTSRSRIVNECCRMKTVPKIIHIQVRNQISGNEKNKFVIITGSLTGQVVTVSQL